MPQMVDEAGNIWEIGPDGKPRYVGRQQSQPEISVTPLPESPGKQADRQRDDAAANRDNIRTGIQARGEGRDVTRLTFDQAKALREEFTKNPAVETYRVIMRQYATGLKTDQSPAGDQALINAYSQMLNPTSTVMLGEYEAAEDVDSTLSKVRERLKKEFGWDGAGRISDKARNQLLQEMQNISASANEAYNQERQRYAGLAQQYGYTPEEVTGPHIGQPYWDDVRDYWQKRGVEILPEGKDETGNPLPQGSRPQPPRKPGYRASPLGQGISGVYSGLASMAGAPVDFMTGAMNLIPRGINAAANTNIPTIQGPIGGSDWIRDRMGSSLIHEPTSAPAAQFARRVGESLGASLIPAGFAGSAGRAGATMLAGLGGGAGAATAQQVRPNDPLAEFFGEVAGGGVTGMGMLGSTTRNARRQIEAGVPTVDQLKDQAGAMYRQAEARGVTAGPMQTQQLADDLRTTLRKDGRVSPTGRISEVYPKAKEGMQLVEDYAGQPMTPGQMEVTRKIIAEGMASADPAERRIASQLIDTFDNWSTPMAPEFADARDIASRYLNAGKLETARELARSDASNFTSSGLENATRRRYRELDRATIKGGQRFSDDLTGAIENVSRGTPGSNAARALGRYAPTGPVSMLGGAGLGAAVGTSLAGPVGGLAAGALVAGAGRAGRVAATRMTDRNAEIAELIARNGGKLPAPNVVTPEVQRAIDNFVAAQAAKYLEEDRRKADEEERRRKTPQRLPRRVGYPTAGAPRLAAPR